MTRSDRGGSGASPAQSGSSAHRRLFQKLKLGVLYGIGVGTVTLLLFALLEGVASLAFFAFEAMGQGVVRIPRAQYAVHDSDLGWSSRPHVDLPDAYGPGRWMRTEAHGFRNVEDIAPTVPDGHTRIVCSGDSFTQGYGVSNEEAWCHQLTLLDPSLEAVNMGQSGYSLSQAYLWYMRDARALEHDVHLVSFVTVDFARMSSFDAAGYARPGLALLGDTLVAINTPVPRRTVARFFQNRFGQPAANLRIVRFLQAALRRVSGPRPGPSQGETEAIAHKIFATLAEVNEEKGSQLVLVYLPTFSDFAGSVSDPWRALVGQFADSASVPYIDLIAELRRLDRDSLQTLFLKEGEVEYTGAAGHYSAAGNRWVAETLHRRLIDASTIPAPSLQGPRHPEPSGSKR